MTNQKELLRVVVLLLCASAFSMGSAEAAQPVVVPGDGLHTNGGSFGKELREAPAAAAGFVPPGSFDAVHRPATGVSPGASFDVSPRTAGEARSGLLYGLPAAEDVAQASRRNVGVALVLSAAVPGLGQAYNRQWVKAAAALAIEGGLIAGYFVWRAQGFREERAYQRYAHQFWSAPRYARWLNDFVDYLEQVDGASLGAVPIEIPGGLDFSAPEAWSSEEWQRVRQFFERIHATERVIYHPETGASFSHTLPHFGEQQYYELVGKYFQFGPGWIDYPAWREGDVFTSAIDPELTGPDGTKPNIRGHFLQYARDHAHANTLLRHASRVSSVLILNHFIAALDAAISAKLHNNRLDTDLRLGYGLMNEPTLIASVRWSL